MLHRIIGILFVVYSNKILNMYTLSPFQNQVNHLLKYFLNVNCIFCIPSCFFFPIYLTPHKITNKYCPD